MANASFRIGFVLFDDVTQLDMTGPAQVLARMPGAELHFAAHALTPVRTDVGFAIVPTVRFADCPPLDMICVPGGLGTVSAMRDAALVDWVRQCGEAAAYVTSVCTGALVLGAAGLLRGYRAATYWSMRESLRLFGAEPVAERVVVDRNRITGGGVTAGIDFAFRVIEAVRGLEAAEAVRLVLEYDPQPIGAGGTPETARPEILAQVRAAIAARGGAEREAEIRRIAEAGA